MEFHGFHGNPLCDFKEWGIHTKILIISSATRGSAVAQW